MIVVERMGNDKVRRSFLKDFGGTIGISCTFMYITFT